MNDIDSIELERFKFVVLAALDKHFAISAEVDFSEHIADNITARVIQDIFGKTVEKLEIRYPQDWKQAVKMRFAPQWFLKRWPVIYNHEVMELRALYPSIPDIPDHPYILHMLKNGRSIFEREDE
jgi:hypothetical protein